MAINFPDSPSVNDTHTVGDKTWTWDGTAWNVVVGGIPTTIDTLTINQNAEVDGILTANHIHGNLAGSVYLHVKNTSGSEIAAGTPVYATGSVGASGATEVSPSDASTAGTMPAVGITQSTLAINAEGHATILGVIGSQDTSTYSLNQPLYVAPGGGLTATRPTAATDAVQSIARVVRVDASSGELLVMGAGRTNDVPNEINILGDLTVDTDTLHVDSTNDRVGIGTASPAENLDVSGANNDVSLLLRSGDTSNGANGGKQIVMGYAGTANYGHNIRTRHNGGAQSGNAIDFYTWNYGTDAINTYGTKLVMSAGADAVLMPYQPAFKVTSSTYAFQNVSFNTVVVAFNSAEFNIGGHYSTSTYRFTAPVDGRYFFSANLRYDNAPTSGYRRLFIGKNGANYNSPSDHVIVGNGVSTNYHSLSVSGIHNLTAGDYVDLRAESNGASADLRGESTFSGILIG